MVLPSHHLTVGPVLRVVNLLPCELTYFLEGTPIRARLPANKAASVFEVSCADVLRFGVLLDNFPRCEPIHIPPATFSDTVLMNIFDQFGRLLQLKVLLTLQCGLIILLLALKKLILVLLPNSSTQVEVCTRALGSRHVTLSAVCWLINHSGLPLVFAAQAPSSLACQSEWQVPGSPQHRSLAAGQSGEQELARLASPLLFSPPIAIAGSAAPVGSSVGASSNSRSGSGTNYPSSWSLQVRLGAYYSPTESDKSDWIPRWSTPITLDKGEQELMLRLRAGGSSTRPDLLYSVGVEVRAGTGLHAATALVTFVPRFMISNQTNFQLQYTQRFCLDSTAHKPSKLTSVAYFPYLELL